MAVQPTNKFGRKISNSQLSVEGLQSRAESYTVHTNNYVLNKVKALRKKLIQCENEHLTYQMKANKNFVMKLSTSAYELAKLVVIEHLYSDSFFKDYSIVSCINEDENQNQVGSLYRIFNKKKDGSSGIQLKFAVNFYHTTSSILVNGNRVDIFESELFGPICETIKSSCSRLSIVNEQISQALSAADSMLTVNVNETGTRPKEIAYDTNGCADSELMLIEGEMNNSIENTDSDLTPQNVASNCNRNSTENQYTCPSCEQPANSETIECEECGEWFHFECVGLSKQSAEQIHSDVPFICLFCNDGLLYAPKSDEQSEDCVAESNKSDSNTDTAKLNQINVISTQNTKDNESPLTGTPPKELMNKKTKAPKKNSNANGNKKNSLTDQQETIFAQKFYISSLEAKVNNLESTVTLLKNTLSKSDNLTSVSYQSTSGSKDSERSELPNEHTLKTIENKLSMFEMQMMNNFMMQNQMNFQHHMNIQNQLTLINAQTQLSFAQSQARCMYGPTDSRPTSVYPAMMTTVAHGPVQAVPYAVNYGNHPFYMNIGTHATPTLQQITRPRVIMTHPPPTYPGHGLSFLQQPQQQGMFGPQQLAPPQQMPPYPQSTMVPAQNVQVLPPRVPTSVQPSAEPTQPSVMREAPAPQAMENESQQTQAGHTSTVDVGQLTTDTNERMETPIIISDDQPVPPTESSGSTIQNEAPICNSAQGSNESVSIEHSQNELSRKSDSKTHFLEIPSLKEMPPDMDPLRTVVCAAQNRL